MRSSSWAQTDAAQVTVTTPPRSAVGLASAAIAGARHGRPRTLDRRQERSRARS